ncbi:uncharacterized protein LOC134282859 [Saccostrea cucullata]|uniref:uncharacterized protein LOC134282859 n=1 Tax=Saccostrea cuccullata TaxID=36930 RepID=UPI002ED2E4E4
MSNQEERKYLTYYLRDRSSISTAKKSDSALTQQSSTEVQATSNNPFLETSTSVNPILLPPTTEISAPLSENLIHVQSTASDSTPVTTGSENSTDTVSDSTSVSVNSENILETESNSTPVTVSSENSTETVSDSTSGSVNSVNSTETVPNSTSVSESSGNSTTPAISQSTSVSVSSENLLIDITETVTSASLTTETNTTTSTSTVTSSVPLSAEMLRSENSVQLPKFSGKSGNVSATQWWMLFIQWCSLHSLSEQQILGRIVFYLTDMAQQWYLSLPQSSRNTLQQLKASFLLRFGKQNSFNLDVLDVKQKIDESCEEYITRIQQMACDDNIPNLMLINLIANGFKAEIAEKVLHKDPQNFEDLFKYAKRAESTIKLRKNDSVIASIEGMEDRLMDRLSKQLESTVMAFSGPQNQARYNGNSRGRGQPQRYPNQYNSDFRRNEQTRDNYRGNKQFPNSGSQYREGRRPMGGNHGNRFPHPAQQPSDFTRQHGNRPAQYQRPAGPSKCSSCFKNTCDRMNCIAIGKQCYYCYGYNHFQIACFSNPQSPFFKHLTDFESVQ